MRFANSYDIAVYVRRHPEGTTLGNAARTLRNLEQWANANSDGWAYWPKPARAATRLIEFLEYHSREFRAGPTDETIAAEYRAALRPVKAFRTRHSADFEILEGVIAC